MLLITRYKKVSHFFRKLTKLQIAEKIHCPTKPNNKIVIAMNAGKWGRSEIERKRNVILSKSWNIGDPQKTFIRKKEVLLTEIEKRKRGRYKKSICCGSNFKTILHLDFGSSVICGWANVDTLSHDFIAPFHTL